jgi:hypothetical protein
MALVGHRRAGRAKTGYVTFSRAAFWIATKGGQRRFRLDDRQVWKSAYDELLERIASGEVEAIGRKNERGENKKIPGRLFTQLQISLPFEHTPDRILFRDYPYIRCCVPVDGDLWEQVEGFDDRLFLSGRATKSKWRHLQVNGAHVALFWSFRMSISATMAEDRRPQDNGDLSTLGDSSKIGGRESLQSATQSQVEDEAKRPARTRVTPAFAKDYAKQYVEKTIVKQEQPTQRGIVEAAQRDNIKGGRELLRKALVNELGSSAPERGPPRKNKSPK